MQLVGIAVSILRSSSSFESIGGKHASRGEGIAKVDKPPMGIGIQCSLPLSMLSLCLERCWAVRFWKWRTRRFTWLDAGWRLGCNETVLYLIMTKENRQRQPLIYGDSFLVSER